MRCNWGVLGPGFIATQATIPAMQQVPRACVLAIARSDEQRAQTASLRFGIERAYHGYQALLDDPDINAVYIALPNHLHQEWTIRAAQAGKHVLFEKPLAMSAAECEGMLAACRQADVLLMEAVMYRFHPRMLHPNQVVTPSALCDVTLLHASVSV